MLLKLDSNKRETIHIQFDCDHYLFMIASTLFTIIFVFYILPSFYDILWVNFS